MSNDGQPDHVRVEPAPDRIDGFLDYMSVINEPPRIETLHRRDILNGLDKLLKETDIDEYGKKKNTAKAYDPKVSEFNEFCNEVFGGEPLQTRFIVDDRSVQSFFLYVGFREQKPRGRVSKGEEENWKSKFNVNEWNRIARMFRLTSTGQLDLDKTIASMVQPTKGVGFATMVTTKAAIKKLWLNQVEGTPNIDTEHKVFGHTVRKIMQIVRQRKVKEDHKNCVEKIDKDSAPMESVSHIQLLEESLFNIGVKKSGRFSAINKSVHASLRNRFTFLCTTTGILRGESLFKAELSDLFKLDIKLPKDPHEFTILIMQISSGKTNQNGYKIFGRMGRNFDVNVCPVGALGFYLMYRFHHTRELNDDQQPVDWTNNKSWYHIKLLTEFGTSNSCRCISDSTYSNAIKKICAEKKIPSRHWVHIGRILGAYESEINEDEREDIRNIGNWGLSTQET